MSMSKIAAVAGVFALTATSVFAMTKMTKMGDEALLIQPSADYGMVSYKSHADMAKHARVSEGALLYRNGGKLYIVENKKMPGGAMLFEENWFKQAVGAAGASP
jgi:hypothetical protein